MSTAVHITWHGAQINLGDLPPCLTYGFIRRPSGSLVSCMQVQGDFSQWMYITLPSTLFNGLTFVKSVMTTSPVIILRERFPCGTKYFNFKWATRQLTVHNTEHMFAFFIEQKGEFLSLRFLGIILRVLRLEVSVFNVYITNQFQITFDFWSSEGGE